MPKGQCRKPRFCSGRFFTDQGKNGPPAACARPMRRGVLQPCLYVSERGADIDHPLRASWPFLAIRLQSPRFRAPRCDEPMRSACGLEARLRMADEIIGADMGELAFGIEPDLAAEIAPFLAEAEIFAHIGPGFRVDETFEKRVALAALGIAIGVHARIAGLRIGFDHALDHLALEQLEAAAAIDAGGEASFALELVAGAERADIEERGGLETLAGGQALQRRIAPIDDFQRIDSADEILIEGEHCADLLRIE